MKNWFSIKAKQVGQSDQSVYAISIHDEIGGWGVSAADFLTQLGAIPTDAKIELSLNSPGGDVFDGLAMYNALKARRANVEAHVLGTACSMASIILMAASKRVMPENAYIMVHGITGLCYGSAADMLDQATLIGALETTLRSIYVEGMGQDEETIKQWMSKDTWFDGKQALEAGLCDEVVATLQLAACANASALQRYDTAPDSVKQLFAMTQKVEEPAPAPSEENEAQARLNATSRCLAAGESVLAGMVSNGVLALQDLDARLERTAGIRALAATAGYPKVDDLIENNKSITEVQTLMATYLQNLAPVVNGAQESGNEFRLPSDKSAKKTVAEAVNVTAVYANRNPKTRK